MCLPDRSTRNCACEYPPMLRNSTQSGACIHRNVLLCKDNAMGIFDPANRYELRTVEIEQGTNLDLSAIANRATTGWRRWRRCWPGEVGYPVRVEYDRPSKDNMTTISTIKVTSPASSKRFKKHPRMKGPYHPERENIDGHL